MAWKSSKVIISICSFIKRHEELAEVLGRSLTFRDAQLSEGRRASGSGRAAAYNTFPAGQATCWLAVESELPELLPRCLHGSSCCWLNEAGDRPMWGVHAHLCVSARVCLRLGRMCACVCLRVHVCVRARLCVCTSCLQVRVCVRKCAHSHTCMHMGSQLGLRWWLSSQAGESLGIQALHKS